MGNENGKTPFDKIHLMRAGENLPVFSNQIVINSFIIHQTVLQILLDKSFF